MDHLKDATEPSTNMDLCVKLEANLNPLVNATPNALSTLFTLVFGKKYTNAARQSILNAAQNQVDARRILEGKAFFDSESEGVVQGSAEHNEIRKMVQEIIQEEEITNLISCTVHAANSTKDQFNGDESGVSTEFLNRWRNEAKFIAEETAQAIWGRILSAEIKSPNSVSIRTLEVLKCLTREEAEAFREACRFVFFDEYLLDSTVDGNPVAQSSYVMMKDAGLITNYQKGFYTSCKWPETSIAFDGTFTEAYFLKVGNLFLYAEKALVKEPPSTSYWTLTKAGVEMCRIISKEIDYDITTLGVALTAKNPQLINHLKYTNYTNTKKSEIDIKSAKNVF